MTPVSCQGFELHGRNAARFQIGLETVLEPLELSTNAACTVSQLSMQRLLWYSVILHAYHVAGPSKLCCHEETLMAGLGSIDGCLLVELPALVLVFTYQARLNAI